MKDFENYLDNYFSQHKAVRPTQLYDTAKLQKARIFIKDGFFVKIPLICTSEPVVSNLVIKDLILRYLNNQALKDTILYEDVDCSLIPDVNKIMNFRKAFKDPTDEQIEALIHDKTKSFVVKQFFVEWMKLRKNQDTTIKCRFPYDEKDFKELIETSLAIYHWLESQGEIKLINDFMIQTSQGIVIFRGNQTKSKDLLLAIYKIKKNKLSNDLYYIDSSLKQVDHYEIDHFKSYPLQIIEQFKK